MIYYSNAVLTKTIEGPLSRATPSRDSSELADPRRLLVRRIPAPGEDEPGRQKRPDLRKKWSKEMVSGSPDPGEDLLGSSTNRARYEGRRAPGWTGVDKWIPRHATHTGQGRQYRLSRFQLSSSEWQ